MNNLPDSLTGVTALPPQIDIPRVAEAVLQQFELSGEYRLLVSERDQNFRLTSDDGRRFVVKISGLAEPLAEVDLQLEALLHLQRKALDFTPRIVRTSAGLSSGKIAAGNGKSFPLRVVTWLDGRLLADSVLNADVAGKLGRRLAMLDIALADFAHPASERVMLWDTQKAAILLSLTDSISDADTRSTVEDVLQHFSTQVEPLLASLPRQIIHNDANPENILLNEQACVTGIIDFGDMLQAPRIIELATAASYLRSASNDPLLFIAPLVAAYRSRLPLLQEEEALLYHLVRTRLAMTLTILYWRLAARDEDDPYRQKTLKSESNAFDFLRNLSVLGESGFRARTSEENTINTIS